MFSISEVMFRRTVCMVRFVLLFVINIREVDEPSDFEDRMVI